VSAITTALTKAAADAKSGDLEHAQTALMGAWAKTPADALRGVILSLDDVLTRSPFDGTTDEWLKVKDTKAKRGALVASLKGPTLADVARRFGVAAEWGSDPRVTRQLEQVLTELPWTSDSSKPAWNAVFAAVAASKDPRFVELVATLPKTWKVRDGIKGWLERAFARSVERLPQQAPALEKSDEQLLSQVTSVLNAAPKKAKAAAPGRDEEALLADIYANPRDDAPRLVYADVLQERGDPRGEFIALQCAGTTGKQVNELLKANLKKWLGPLAPVLGAQVEFRRGFPAVGKVKFRHQADAEKYGNLREWATFEELSWSASYPPQEQLPYCRWAGPSMRWLTRAHLLHVPHLLAAKQPWTALQELEVEFTPPTLFEKFLAAQPTVCPKLHTLVSTWLTAEQLRHVTSLGSIKVLGIHSQDFGPAIAKASSLGLDELRIGEDLTFRRGADGELSACTVNPRERSIAWTVKSIPNGLVESVTFDLPKGATPDAELEAAARAKVRKPGAKSGFAAAKAEAAAPELLRELRNVYGLTALADGTAVVIESDRLLFVDPKTKLLKHTATTAGANQVEISADGKRAVLASYKRLSVVDLTKRGEEVFSVTLKEEVRTLTLSSDDKVVGLGRGLSFDLERRKEVDAPRGAGKSFLMNPDGRWWLRRGADQGVIEVMRPGSNKGVPLEDAGVLNDTLLDGDALLGRTGEYVVRWDLTTGKATAKVKLEAGACLYRSPDRTLLATHEGKKVTVLDARTLEKVRTVTPAAYVNCVGFLPDGKLLVAGQTLEVL
jgi:uncharacterized protein (TIGR02996 family)